MSTKPFDFTSQSVAASMLDGLTESVRLALRKRLEEKIKADIDVAIDNAMKHFEVSLRSYADPMNMRNVIEVLLRDERHEV